MTADPLERFEEEHDKGLAQLDRLEAAAEALEAGSALGVHLDVVRDVHEFLSTAVREHNENEERALFPELGDDAPTAPFTDEHVTLRRLEGELKEAIESADAAETIPPVVRELAGLLRDHIQRENDVLFPAARTLLGAEGLARVAARLDA